MNETTESRVGRMEGVVEQINERLGSMEKRIGRVEIGLVAIIAGIAASLWKLWTLP